MPMQADQPDNVDPPGNVDASGEFGAVEEDSNGWFSEEAATLGDRIAGAREAAGLSQVALAHKLGLKPVSLRKWEDDLSEPRANRLQMLSGMLGVSLTWLMTGRGDGPDGPDDIVTMPADVASALKEIRLIRARLETTSNQLGQLEKHLRRYIQGQS